MLGGKAFAAPKKKVAITSADGHTNPPIVCSNGDFIALARSWISYPKNRDLQHTQMNTQMVPHDTSGDRKSVV